MFVGSKQVQTAGPNRSLEGRRLQRTPEVCFHLGGLAGVPNEAIKTLIFPAPPSASRSL